MESQCLIKAKYKEGRELNQEIRSQIESKEQCKKQNRY